jgi:hypothetical protein
MSATSWVEKFAIPSACESMPMTPSEANRASAADSSGRNMARSDPNTRNSTTAAAIMP